MNSKTVVNWLCLSPFIGLLTGVFVLDEYFTDGTGVGKIVFFYGMMALVPLAASLSYWANRRSLKYSMTDWLVPLFAALGLVITYLSHPMWNTKMVTLLLLVVLYFSLRIVLVQHEMNRHILLLCVVVTGFVESLWGLLQLYGYTPSQHVLFRVTGSFFNPGPYAGYLAAVLPMAVFYSLQGGKTIYGRQGIALVTLFGIALVLPATMSRAAWIAGGTGMLVVGICYLFTCGNLSVRYYLSLRNRKGIMVWLAAALLAGISVTGLYHLKKDSADGRALIWKVSMDLIEKQWPLGSGLGYFSGSYGDAQQDYFASGRGTVGEAWLAGEPQYAFNELIQVAVELGLLPLAILLVIVIYACITGIRRGKLAEAGSLVALLVFSSLSYPFSLMPFLVVMVLLIAACVSVRYRFTDVHDFGYKYLFNYKIRRRWNNVWIISLLLMGGVMTACCLYSRYPVYEAHKKWGRARPLYRANAYEKVVESYQDLLPCLGDQVYYLFEYGQALSKIERYEESNRVIGLATRVSADPMLLIILGKNRMGAGDYKYAQTYFERAAQRVPNRLYPYYLMAKAYREAGNLDKAEEVARQVVAKQVKVDSPATREMKAEMKAMINQLEQENAKIRTKEE
ncbi:O-antigen ligase family protein [Parapedobacter defluvii]|nr:O-antigen ligase family protein [Parapedobacter defluvii]